jgi:hypothetical protein
MKIVTGFKNLRSYEKVNVVFNGLTTVLSGLTLLAVIAYTCVSFNQWRTAENQLEVSERPWMTVDIPNGVSDFSFHPGGHAFLRSALVLKNIGHSPAIGIASAYIVIYPRRNEMFDTPVKKQKELFEPLRKEKSMPGELGVGILFPGQQTSPLGFSASVAKETVDSGSFTFPDDPGKYVTPVLVGCVDYRLSFAPERHHQTGFIYMIGKYKPAEPTHYISIQVGIDVPLSSLKLDQYFFGGHYAD